MEKPDLHAELLAMKRVDEELHTQLSEAGALTGHYVPSLQAVHDRNAARLREILSEHGWPNEIQVGSDGAYAAWIILQHSIGDPKLQRAVLPMLEREAASGLIPAWQTAYLADRIAMYEGRPQRYGTQWLDDTKDGRARPWPILEPDRVDSLRGSVGLGPLARIPDRGPDLSQEEQQARSDNERWWRDWLANRGW